MAEFEDLLLKGAEPHVLAQAYLNNYFHNNQPIFPINPFQMLSDLGIYVSFRAFEKYDGIYIPADDSNDIPVVGINVSRPITRQRFTAAHEICHHLKDTGKVFVCTPGSNSNMERYAENFAAELLMPIEELKKQTKIYMDNKGFVEFDFVVNIAHYFGVSFKACLCRLAYCLRCIDGDISGISLEKRINSFKPDKNKEKLGLSDVFLYDTLFNSTKESFVFSKSACDFARNKFQNEYIYFDSRMEGIDIDREKASEVVTDLRILKSESSFCSSEFENIVFTAGLSNMFGRMFEISNYDKLSIYNILELNRELYSCAPFPEAGGQLRDINTLVLGTKFETVDYSQILAELNNLNETVIELVNSRDKLEIAEYIKKAIQIHYKLTVIHPFKDGNGRTTRAFFNILMLKVNLPPVFFRTNYKTKYKDALRIADTTGNFNPLYEVFFQSLLLSICDLSRF